MANGSSSDKYYNYREPKRSTSDKVYFSGANVRVYFGDVWVEEMASIQFSVQENVAPIYGFNSYMFDKVARGTRLVSGTFVVNYTRAGYIETILERLYKNIDPSAKNLFDGGQGFLKRDTKKNHSDRNIQDLLQVEGGDSYNSYVVDLRNSFWGKESASQNTIHKTGLGREYDTMYYKNPEGLNKKNLLKDHGFNVLIDYSPSANEKDFAECLKGIAKKDSLFQSYRTIIGLHITGEDQIIAPDGRPLQTQYSFIARDLDGDITQLSMKYNQLHNTNEQLGVNVAKRT